MKLIVGLGNPGSRYDATRHNVGFMVLDRLAARLRASWRAGKGDYEWADTHQSERLLLVKPMTYMNNSGLAVRDVVHFYKIALADMLIICDDVAIPFGSLRLRAQGSDGGQNGLRSVIYQLNSDAFARMRIGIANDRAGGMDLADFVLSRFDTGETQFLEGILDRAADAALTWIREGIHHTMNVYNKTTTKNEMSTDDRPTLKKESPDA